MKNIPLRDRAWPAPTPQEQIEDTERDAHENFLCEGLPYCSYCLDQRDLDDMVEHVNNELDREKKRA